MTITLEKNCSIKLSDEFNIKSFEVNALGLMKPSVLFHYLEDMAYRHAEKYGFGYSATYPNGYGWFLLKCHIKITALPHTWDKIKLETWAVESKGLQCRRDFSVYDEEGSPIANVATSWGLVNMETKRLVNPFKVLTFPKLYPEYSLETNFPKIETVEDVTFSKEFEIRFDDVDLNHHVNNSIYIGWATETMPYEFLKTHTLSEIEIYFKRETKYGVRILSEVYYNKENNVSIHSIKNADTNEELTLLRLKWN